MYAILIWLHMLYWPLRTSSSGMAYQDAEKLYAEVRADAEAAVNDVLCVLYPDSVPFSSAGAKPASGPLTMFGHDTMPFPRRDVVCVPLAEGRVNSGDVLHTTSDGEEGYVALEGGAGGVLFLPSQISEKGLRCANSDTNSFVSGNGVIQLTAAGGRITSLFDVRLKSVLYHCSPYMRRNLPFAYIGSM